MARSGGGDRPPQLTYLSLHDCALSHAHVGPLGVLLGKLPKLEHLDLSGMLVCERAAPSLAHHITRRCALRALTLRGCDTTGPAVEILARQLSRLRSLTRLDMSKCSVPLDAERFARQQLDTSVELFF